MWSSSQMMTRCRTGTSNGRSSATSNAYQRQRQPTALSAARPPRTAEPNMRSTRHSLANLFLVLVTLTLASSVEAAAKGSKGKVKVRPVKSKVLLEGISVKVFKSRDVQRDFCRSFTDSIGLDEKVCAREAPEQPLNSSLNFSHAVVSRPARLLADLPLCFSRGGSFLGTVQTNIFSVLQDQESGARVSHVLHKLHRSFRD